MKKLFTFTVPFKTIVDNQVEKIIDGKPMTVVEKIEKIENKEYFIRKPSRSDYDEADFFYDKLFSYNVRQGIVTRSEIIKRFANEDVVIKKVYDDYIAKENELQRISLQDKTEENIQRQKKVEQELLNILVEIQNFEVQKSSVFDRTAENRARVKTIFWWILNLSYKIEKDKENKLIEVPVFDGEDYEKKVETYDVLLENNEPHLQEATHKFTYLISAWYSGQLNTEQDFDKALKFFVAETQKIKVVEAKEQEKAANIETPPATS